MFHFENFLKFVFQFCICLFSLFKEQSKYFIIKQMRRFLHKQKEVNEKKRCFFFYVLNNACNTICGFSFISMRNADITLFERLPV